MVRNTQSFRLNAFHMVTGLLLTSSIVIIATLYPQNQASAATTCAIPALKQTASAWASTSYGNSVDDVTGIKKPATIGTSGCGPTAIAMVASYWKGQNIKPPEVASHCMSKGFRKDGQGTKSGCISSFASSKGLKSEKIGADKAKRLLKGYVVNGVTYKQPIIMTVNPCLNGKYTKGGHYIVLTKIVGDTVYINDPNKNNAQDTVSNIFTTCQKEGFWYVHR